MRTRRPGSGFSRPPGIARTLSERDRPAQTGLDAAAPFGLDGLFATLCEAMERFGQASGGSGEKTIDIGGREGRLVFGYSVRTGGGVEPFGHVAEAGRAPDSAAPRQPIIDIHTDAADIVVIAELPGLAEADVTVALDARTLLIAAAGWRKQVELPEPVLPGSLRRSCRNGILEIRLTRDAS